MSFTDLPLVNACLNGLSTVLLAAGFKNAGSELVVARIARGGGS